MSAEPAPANATSSTWNFFGDVFKELVSSGKQMRKIKEINLLLDAGMPENLTFQELINGDLCSHAV